MWDEQEGEKDGKQMGGRAGRSVGEREKYVGKEEGERDDKKDDPRGKGRGNGAGAEARKDDTMCGNRTGHRDEDTTMMRVNPSSYLASSRPARLVDYDIAVEPYASRETS